VHDRRGIETVRRAAEERGEGCAPPHLAAERFRGPLLTEAVAPAVEECEGVAWIVGEHR
jgi:hypothetical protein